MGSPLRPALTDKVRVKRRGQAGRSWHADETYIEVSGVWKYLFRVVDRNGGLVDSMLSNMRDMDVAKRYFTQAPVMTEQAPEWVMIDAQDSSPPASRATLRETVTHRCNPYLNKRIEQDHRGINQRYYPLRGFGLSVPPHDSAPNRHPHLMNSARISGSARAGVNVR